MLLSAGKAICDRVTLPILRCMLGVFSVSKIPPNSDVDYGIFNVHTDVNACDCKMGCTGTASLKVDFGRKIPFRTRESNLRQRRDGPML